jgi:hypothetical protein
MLFVASALAGGLFGDTRSRSGDASNAAVFALGRRVTGLLINTYATRMAAVFTLSTATINLRNEALPRWLALSGFGVGLVLRISIGLTPWVELLFPAWILLVSIDVLRTGLRTPPLGANP